MDPCIGSGGPGSIAKRRTCSRRNSFPGSLASPHCTQMICVVFTCFARCCASFGHDGKLLTHPSHCAPGLHAIPPTRASWVSLHARARACTRAGARGRLRTRGVAADRSGACRALPTYLANEPSVAGSRAVVREADVRGDLCSARAHAHTSLAARARAVRRRARGPCRAPCTPAARRRRSPGSGTPACCAGRCC